MTVVTNTTTVGAYRGAGRPEATQLIERVSTSPPTRSASTRPRSARRNFLQPGDVPAHHADRRQLRLAASTRRRSTPCSRPPATPTLRAEQAARRASGDVKQLGIGLSAYVEVTAPVGLHVEYGAVEVHDDGTATVFAGTSVHGQGHHTAFAMLASDVLGIPMDKITLVNSDTDDVPRGAGTMGSRSLQTAG